MFFLKEFEAGYCFEKEVAVDKAVKIYIDKTMIGLFLAD